MPPLHDGLKPLVGFIQAARRAAGRRIVVAIDGRSGTGKSTLARALAAPLKAVVVEGDDFYAGGVGPRDDSPASRAAACIDWRRQRTVIDQLVAGRHASYRAFDWDAFDGSLRGQRTRVVPGSVIVLEGVYSARAELADRVDLAVLVTASDAVRRQRLIAREGGIGPWERQWLDAEAWYFAEGRCGPFHATVDTSTGLPAVGLAPPPTTGAERHGRP